jgi:hypothetical protein
MPLTWDVTNVECWEDMQADEWQRVITESVVIHCMPVGLGRITLANLTEWQFRSGLLQAAHGPFAYRNGKDYFVTNGDLHRRVGLRTNNTDTPRTRWLHDNSDIGELVLRKLAVRNENVDT